MEVASFSEKTAVTGVNAKDLSCKRVLVVEDDKDVTALLNKVLQNTFKDARVHWATSFEDSVRHLIENSEVAQKSPYDLIIADVFLEGHGIGLDLFKLINRTYSEIPFLIMSSLPYEQVSEALEAEKKDNIVFLAKPFQLSQCKQKIKNLMSYQH